MESQLQVGEETQINRRDFSQPGGALAFLETAFQRQPHIVETKLAEQFFYLSNQFARRLDLAQGFWDRVRSRAHAEKLATFKFPAAGRTSGINRTGAGFKIERRAGLRDPRAVSFEQRRGIVALAPHVGEENAAAAQATSQAKRVGEFFHDRFSH